MAYIFNNSDIICSIAKTAIQNARKSIMDKSISCLTPISPEHFGILNQESIKNRERYMEKDEYGIDELPQEKFGPQRLDPKFNTSPLKGAQNFLQGYLFTIRSSCRMLHPNKIPIEMSNRKIMQYSPKLIDIIKSPTPPLKDGVTRSKKNETNLKDSVKCIKEHTERDACERSDDDRKLKIKPFRIISYSPKNSIELAIKPSEPIKRLAKFTIQEVKRSCPTSELERSELKLEIKKKKTLPPLKSGLIKKMSTHQLIAPPILRLKKILISEPQKNCKVEICEKKTCKSFSVPKKKLPSLSKSTLGPQVPHRLENIPAIKRLPRLDPIDTPSTFSSLKCEVNQQADEEQCDTKRKEDSREYKLPKLSAGEYMVRTLISHKNPTSSLKIPKKSYKPQEPKKMSSVVPSERMCKENSSPTITMKLLPRLSVPPKLPTVLCTKERKDIRKMKKVSIPEPLKICHPPPCKKNERVDVKMKNIKKSLPKLGHDPLPPFKTPSVPKIVPICRLPKFFMKEQICPVKNIEKCVPTEESENLSALTPSHNSDNNFISITDQPRMKKLGIKLKNVQQARNFSRNFFDSNLPIAVQKNTRGANRNNSKGISGIKSMCTNLMYHSSDGFLTRKTQLSHIDMRKRFSSLALGMTEFTPHISRNYVHSSSYKCKDELQPKYLLYWIFKKNITKSSINYEAPRPDPEKEDQCIIKECCNMNDVGPTGASEKDICTDVVSTCSPESSHKSDSSSPSQTPISEGLRPHSPPYVTTMKVQHPCTCPCPAVRQNPTPSPCKPCPKFANPCPKFANPCPQKMSLLRRIINYFKPRANCPPPGLYKKKKMIRKIQKMADKAGLAVYDPCGDPNMICEEVRRRCCLARKCGISQKRNFHCYGSTRNFHSSFYPIVIHIRTYCEDVRN